MNTKESLYTQSVDRVKHFLLLLKNQLFPHYCVGCKQEGNYLCRNCKQQLQPHPDCCPFCHRVMPYGQRCFDCSMYHKTLEGCMIAFQYSKAIKKLILSLKYYHHYDITLFLGQKLALLIQSNPALMHAHHEQKLFISYVPSHRRKKWMIKGYNQSQLLAESVAKELSLSCIPLREKTKRTRSQATLTREKRLTNLRGVFTNTETETLPLDATICIIDDITTTGATLEELARQLKNAEPTMKIRGVVVGRHGK